jgi:dTDP-4-dehydrorhamnose reductase
MRVLVTGASGLLGLNLALEAARRHTVFGVVHRHPLQTEAFAVIEADLLEPGAIQRTLEQARPDWVIHCAALANVDACEGDPDLARRLNAELPGKLAAAATRGGARLLHVSTDAVFDGQRGGYTEGDPPNPLSVYARTKLAGERAAAEAYPEAIIARVNLFGWSPSGRRGLAEWFLNNLWAGREMLGFTDVFFCPLLATDLADLMLSMLAAKLKGLYHVVSATCLSKYDFGVALARQFGLNAKLIAPASVTDAGLKAARSPRLTLRAEKLARALGQPPPDVMSGLERLHRQYLGGYRKRLQSIARSSTDDQEDQAGITGRSR